MTYRVRQSDSAAAEEQLLRLWRDNLNMRGDPRHKFEWYYRDNPLGPAVPFLLEHVTDAGETAVVGSCGVGTRRVYVEGKPLNAALFADFTVDKEHRTLLPALTLQRALCGYALSAKDLAYAYPNDAAVGIFNRIGLRTLGRARRYVKILHSAPFLERHLYSRAAASLTGFFLDGALRARDRIRGRSARHDVEWVTDTDARFERLWNEARTNWRIIGDRSAGFLRWRFLQRPGVPARIAALANRRTGAIDAYAAIVDKEPGVALVADFLASSDRSLKILLTRIGTPLARAGYSHALTYFLGPHRVDDVLLAAGFSFRNAAKFVIVGAREGAPLEKDALVNPDDWYLTEADRDN